MNRFYEEDLSKNKDYRVVSIDYMNTGVLRVCVEKNGIYGEAADYPDRYSSVKKAEHSIIQRALHEIETQEEYFCEICNKPIDKEEYERIKIHESCK